MSKTLTKFKLDVDDWVKDLNRKVNHYEHIPKLVGEHSDNIDHNYELIQEMRAELVKLREEISALRMIQILHLRSEVQKAKN